MNERATARAFVALALGAELGQRVGESCRRALGGSEAARRFRLPRGAGLHLTLFFLGDVARERIEPLAAELARSLSGQRAPDLVLRGGGAFPDPLRPRVLWIGCEELDPGRLEACRRGVLAGLAAAGIDTRGEEREPFRAHVTVARPRGPRARVPAEFLALDLREPWKPCEVLLLDSHMQAGGSRYEPLGRWPLFR